ncbi:MAG TPA: class I SAM-dependent methyltransferase [Candidatus Eisenbacteria bacterium]|nr:class I SAM-dependent methyltransferase [Candidatus Eisenbacteria bacterium]
MSATYALGHSERELKRLETQAALIDPMTRRYFLEAGLRPGMRVLDIGSGAGDVAFLAAAIVGPAGAVVGVDRVPEALATARARAEERSLGSVSFREGELEHLVFDEPFDALVGRYVLMFQERPEDVLRKVARHVKPGGPIVMHEPDWDGARSFPPAPLFDRSCDWIVRAIVAHGHASRMGKALHATFLAAGLPAPTMGLDTLIGGGPKSAPLVGLIADLTGTLAGEIERRGIATAAEMEVETLGRRMLEEAVALDSVLVGRYEVGAWCAKP